MNTNALKTFAQQARVKLIKQVAEKLRFVLSQADSTLLDQSDAINKLKKEIAESSEAQVIEKVAYTWFNRFVALRFMDANEYQPLGVGVISPKEGFTLPEILSEAQQGDIHEDLEVDRESVNTVLLTDQNKAFKLLLIGACNHLHSIFPFLFEKINDYTDLLLPDDLTSEYSIIHDIREGMPLEDCQEVEIIGWLYQFYISEKKDEVFAKKGKVEADEIPAATQLFTPRWIVEYMVQNTLGKLWLQNKPQSNLKESMPYYIDSPSAQSTDFLKVESVEDLTLLDQACGSGHILVYAFDVLAKIYEEEGYSTSEIPKLILEKNLYGFEIDERASQLSGFALMMKAREYFRRVFRKGAKPNILRYEDIQLTVEQLEEVTASLSLTKEVSNDLKLMLQATNLGSLIQPESSREMRTEALAKIEKEIQTGTIYTAQFQQLVKGLKQLQLLGEKYHCIVDNPPYMGGGNMNKPLADFVKKKYPDSKSDLMTVFMEAGLNAIKKGGIVGMINLPSWLFLSSFEKLRSKLVKTKHIDSLLHMGRGIFGVDWGSVAFIISDNNSDSNGTYFRLHKRNFQHLYPKDIRNIFLKAKEDNSVKINYDKYREDSGTNSLEKLIDNEGGQQVFYTANQKDFEKIPGSPIGYWLSENHFTSFENFNSLNSNYEVKSGIMTGGDVQFLRNFWEVKNNTCGKGLMSSDQMGDYYWYPISKGGDFRKWYGNISHVIDLHNNAENINKYAKNYRLRESKYYFKPYMTWSRISSSKISFRFNTNGVLFSDAGPGVFSDDLKLVGFLNSKVSSDLLNIINPTLNYQTSDVENLPLSFSNSNKINDMSEDLIERSRKEWNSRETSWDFLQNELVRGMREEGRGKILEEAYHNYCTHWSEQFIQLHKNEEELNKQFIEIYGLQEELTPDVELKDITILRDELDQKALAKLSEEFSSGWRLFEGRGMSEEGSASSTWALESENPYAELQLPFNKEAIVKQFISYAVGCMFGRYSLDKEGLILANQGETLEDYEAKIEGTPSIRIDHDNIIPVLDDEWFEDDIVTQFEKFLQASFGTENFAENLRFIEEALGKKLRKYFLADFYKDHIKRYKKRPIYWQFSSPKGSFNALIYMHRYHQDTLNIMLNNYIRQFQEKLQGRIEVLKDIEVRGTASEQNKATKEREKIQKNLLEVQDYEREMFHFATSRINIDLDDGVLVNYNRFGKVIKDVAGLNDAKTKKKVKGFDWCDVENI